MRNVVWVFIVFLSGSIYSQSDIILPAEKAAFTSVFFEYKADIRSIPEAAEAILQKHELDAQRYGEIVRAELDGSEIVLLPHEKVKLEAVRQDFELLQAKNAGILDSLCATHEIDRNRYDQILATYRTDIAFQRSLKPFFEQYWKNNGQ